MTDAILTTSWDDGHPLDLRLADMLNRHGIAATFYLPISNREGLPVLDAGQMRELAAAGFEIGVHTLDHQRLDSVPAREIFRQVMQGKATLEDRLGSAVHGFCYPGGRGLRQARTALSESGLHYARTTEMFRLDMGHAPFARPTTLQVFPHGAAALLKNWARQGMGWDRLERLGRCLTHCDLASRLDLLLNEAIDGGGLLHLWGHSWEIERYGLWSVLDAFLARAATRIPRAQRLDNAGAFGRHSCAS